MISASIIVRKIRDRHTVSSITDRACGAGYPLRYCPECGRKLIKKRRTREENELELDDDRYLIKMGR